MLYIVSTPIGNLEDISKRALRILAQVDLILCEDTRVTKKLLERYKIKTPSLSYHQHSNLKKVNYILGLLQQGEDLALVSDAGTPGISDPGNKLISILIDEFMSNEKTGNSSTHQLINSLTISPIPGPSAITAAASVSGFPMDRFLFLGFPPTKRKRKKFFEEIINSKCPVIFYESPYRIIKTLKQLGLMFQVSGFPEAEPRSTPHQNLVGGLRGKQVRYGAGRFQVVVCRELTKKFETIYRGTFAQIIQELTKEKIRGEFVIIVGPRN